MEKFDMVERFHISNLEFYERYLMGKNHKKKFL